MIKRYLPTLAVCLLAFLVSLLHGLSARPLSMASLFDSGQYFITTRLMLGAASAADMTLLPRSLMLDGPVLPAVGAIFYKLSCIEPKATDMRPLIVLQSIIHALSAVALYFTAGRFCRGKKIPLAVALSWALYPGALASTCKFMSEPLAALLVILLVLSAARAGIKSGAVSGALVVLLALTKPALLPGAALMLVLVYTYLSQDGNRKKVFLSALTALLVFGACEIPWLLFSQKQGAMSLTFSRQPTRNMIEGENPETDGWEVRPTSKLASLFDESDPALPTLIALWKEKPDYYAALTLRKVGRLFFDPYNDYRLMPLGLPVPLQVWWHRLLILMSILALSTYLLRNRRETGDAIILGALVMILAHFVYLPFAACSRYNITAMPLVILLAFCTARKIDGSLAGSTGKFAAASILIFALAVLGASLCDLRLQESVVRCTASRPVARKWQMSSPRSGMTCLIIDGKNLSRTTGTITVNGTKMPLALAPLAELDLRPDLANITVLFARLRHLDPKGLRQWYYQRIPVEGDNEISLDADIDIHRGHDSLTQGRYVTLPALEYFSATLFTSSPLNSDFRPPLRYRVKSAKAENLRFYILQIDDKKSLTLY